MDQYIEENLMSNNKEEESKQMIGDLLTFDYFLKIYRTAIVWNRVKFQDQKKELTS